jgi:DNA polymerase elongation subunit (family B)
MNFNGWLIDVVPVSAGMAVWIMDTSGRSYTVTDAWRPSFFLSGSPEFEASLPDLFHRRGIPAAVSRAEKKDFFTHQPLSVLNVGFENPFHHDSLAASFMALPDVRLFNADLSLPQKYFYERGVFPLAFCSFEVEDGGLRGMTLRDSPWTLIYQLPPFRYAHFSLETTSADPNHRRRGAFVLTLGKKSGEGPTYVMDGSEEDLLLSLNRRIAEWDPDILLTDWGDSFLFPRLEFYSQRTGIPLQLSRPSTPHGRSGQAMQSLPGKSFFSYGRQLYTAGSKTLRGRLHIDQKNSFMTEHTGLDGLFEISRVGWLPIQRAARSTIGTSLTSMQLNWAFQNGYLIPLDKGQTEDFRPADDLIDADRGGLVYEPEVGWHEDVIEFDFTSMYPEIMVRNNVTPEAVNCPCCFDNKVPNSPHHICRKRMGMIPAVLGPIVEKRRLYKDLIRANHPDKAVFKRRADAFKWALVTCFGYLGFRNARFGRIEAHECVNAYSREALLKAKETAEAEGFHFLHAIVDSLWLKRSGATDDDVEQLRLKIERAVGLPLGYEGRYRWIRFCASKTNPRVGVPNRYYGAFTTGEIKVRGIELRRHDTPPFLSHLQKTLIDRMAGAKDLDGIRAMKSELDGMVEAARDRLRSGQVSPVDLAFTIQLRKEPERYVHDTLSALAAKKLAASGVKLHPGEMIQYLVTSHHDKVKDWRVMPLAFVEDTFDYDQAYYEALLEKADELCRVGFKSDLFGAVPGGL